MAEVRVNNSALFETDMCEDKLPQHYCEQKLTYRYTDMLQLRRKTDEFNHDHIQYAHICFLMIFKITLMLCIFIVT